MSALDKVLRLAAEVEPYSEEDEAAAIIRAAADDLNELALLLAKSSDDDDDDPDDDGDDDSTAEGDTDHDYFDKSGKRIKKAKKKAKGKGDMVKAAALVLDAMTALSHLQGGETVSLSVLSTKQREKPSAHTIPGSTDYPIPDVGHLKAAIARYKQGALAGHSAKEVAAHIRSRAKALGVTVDLSALEEDPYTAFVNLAAGTSAPKAPGGAKAPGSSSGGYKWQPLAAYEKSHPFKNSSSGGAKPASSAPKTPGPVGAKKAPASGARSAAGAAGAAKKAPGARMRYSAVQHRNLTMHQWHQAHLAHLAHLHRMHLEHMERMHRQL